MHNERQKYAQPNICFIAWLVCICWGENTHTCTHKCDVCFKLGVYTPEANLVSSTSRPESSSVVLAYIHLHIHRWFCRKKACLWCCRWVEWKGENSGVKRGEVIYRMCSEHADLRSHSLCCYWFSPIQKMGSTERESITSYKKNRGRLMSDWCRVNECFSPDRWASYLDRGGGDVWAGPRMHTTFRCCVFVPEAEPGWQAGERDTMWQSAERISEQRNHSQLWNSVFSGSCCFMNEDAVSFLLCVCVFMPCRLSKADLLLRFMVSVILLTVGWTLPSLVGQTSSASCVSSWLVRSFLKNCDSFLEMPWIVGVVWSEIWNGYSDTWGITDANLTLSWKRWNASQFQSQVLSQNVSACSMHRECCRNFVQFGLEINLNIVTMVETNVILQYFVWPVCLHFCVQFFHFQQWLFVVFWFFFCPS